jgi:hypothetical protein
MQDDAARLGVAQRALGGLDRPRGLTWASDSAATWPSGALKRVATVWLSAVRGAVHDLPVAHCCRLFQNAMKQINACIYF